MKQEKKKLYLHGECIIKEIPQLPEKLIKREDKNSIMIAESETVGNEHRIKVKEGVEFFEDENGTLYMRNTLPTEVYCLHANRHDTIEIPEGIWEIDKAVEYGYLKILQQHFYHKQHDYYKFQKIVTKGQRVFGVAD